METSCCLYICPTASTPPPEATNHFIAWPSSDAGEEPSSLCCSSVRQPIYIFYSKNTGSGRGIGSPSRFSSKNTLIPIKSFNFIWSKYSNLKIPKSLISHSNLLIVATSTPSLPLSLHLHDVASIPHHLTLPSPMKTSTPLKFKLFGKSRRRSSMPKIKFFLFEGNLFNLVCFIHNILLFKCFICIFKRRMWGG